MLVSRKQFKQFRNYVTKYIELFGLKEYDVSYKMQSMKDCMAKVHIFPEAYLATFILNKRYSKNDKFDVKMLAWHETCHLLLAKLRYLACSRYVRWEEIITEEERICMRLEQCMYKK